MMGKVSRFLQGLSDTERLYWLQTTPEELVRGNRLTKLFSLLTDFDFVEGKVCHGEIDLEELLGNYEAALSGIDDPEQGKVLQLIRDTLRLSAHILQEDSTQLRSQLWGRLVGFTGLTPQPLVTSYPLIETLLKQAAQNPTYPGLQLYTPTLTPPDTPLIRTLTGHSDSVNSVAVTPDGKKVISGSADNTLKVWDIETGKVLRGITRELESPHLSSGG